MEKLILFDLTPIQLIKVAALFQEKILRNFKHAETDVNTSDYSLAMYRSQRHKKQAVAFDRKHGISTF